MEFALPILKFYGSHPRYINNLKERLKFWSFFTLVSFTGMLLVKYVIDYWRGIDTIGEFADAFTTVYQVHLFHNFHFQISNRPVSATIIFLLLSFFCLLLCHAHLLLNMSNSPILLLLVIISYLLIVGHYCVLIYHNVN